MDVERDGLVLVDKMFGNLAIIAVSDQEPLALEDLSNGQIILLVRPNRFFSDLLFLLPEIGPPLLSHLLKQA